MKHLWSNISPWVLACSANILGSLVAAGITAAVVRNSPEKVVPPERVCLSSTFLRAGTDASSYFGTKSA
jgi:hypothetical protein